MLRPPPNSNCHSGRMRSRLLRKVPTTTNHRALPPLGCQVPRRTTTLRRHCGVTTYTGDCAAASEPCAKRSREQGGPLGWPSRWDCLGLEGSGRCKEREWRSGKEATRVRLRKHRLAWERLGFSLGIFLPGRALVAWETSSLPAGT